MENVGSLQVNEKSHSGGSINRNSLKAVSRAHTWIKVNAMLNSNSKVYEDVFEDEDVVEKRNNRRASKRYTRRQALVPAIP